MWNEIFIPSGVSFERRGVVPVRPVKRLSRQQGRRETWTISAFTNGGRSRCSPALHTITKSFSCNAHTHTQVETRCLSPQPVEEEMGMGRRGVFLEVLEE